MGARYGELKRFRQVKLSIQEISVKLRVPWSTVKRVLYNFERSGRQLKALTAEKPRHFKCIPDHVKQVLLSQDMLEAWAPYSIRER